MGDIKVIQASKEDSEQLLGFFRHYNNKTVSQNRVECYLSHNFTIVAKDRNKIVGILQWHIKEDPNAGTVEFEEIFVLERYRGKEVGSVLKEDISFCSQEKQSRQEVISETWF